LESIRLPFVDISFFGGDPGLKAKLEGVAVMRNEESDGEAEDEVGKNAIASVRRITISMASID
jgi:hypothetical protein